ncbi:MAG: hypothetical protein HPY62_09655, partial [Bacteroidales bacterium]|nr:hypothetical protein [Bacteroidales bacterium]
MKIYHLISLAALLQLWSCQGKFYSEEDFSSVLKIDTHIHINNDDGVFEDQAEKDNFLLISLNVDHGDSANIRSQYDFAVSSVKRFPGRVFFGPTFLFDTAGWGSETWSRKIINQL